VIVVLCPSSWILECRKIKIGGMFRLYGDWRGRVFALFHHCDAAAEARGGLGIIIAFFRNRRNGAGGRHGFVEVGKRRTEEKNETGMTPTGYFLDSPRASSEVPLATRR